MHSKLELAEHIRGLDLLKQPTSEIAAWLQAFGQSGRGQRAELIERLHKTVWSKRWEGKR